MKRTRRLISALLVSVLASLLLAATALAAPEAHQHKEAPKLSPGMQELMGEIRALRKSRMEQLNTEIEKLIEKAEAEKKITSEEAKQLREWRTRKRLAVPPGATEEQVKARLDEAVKNGHLTKEQAKQLLKEWKERQSQRKSRP